MKRYLIVGASSGIGKKTTELLKADAEVWGTYRTNHIEDSHSLANTQEYDVLENEQLELPDVLDGIVYCPGAINLKPFKRIDESMIWEDWKLQVNGAVKTIQQCLPALLKSDNPSVVLYSTVAVQSGYNFHSLVAMSKGAIEGLTRSLAAEYASKIRFNAIAPSLTDTPLAEKLLNSEAKKDANAQRHPMKRIGESLDIANATKFLLSDESAWITGQVLHVDGGMSSLKV